MIKKGDVKIKITVSQKAPNPTNGMHLNDLYQYIAGSDGRRHSETEFLHPLHYLY